MRFNKFVLNQIVKIIKAEALDSNLKLKRLFKIKLLNSKAKANGLQSKRFVLKDNFVTSDNVYYSLILIPFS